jgi:hypothetical protein
VDVVLEVLMWVALVFAAGVVGQFGKSLTLKILERRRERRRLQAGPQAQAPTKDAQKAEKKAAKAAVKQLKKSGRSS